MILAFKEKSNIKIVIEKVNDNAVNCDILVVDDGFQDCTAELTLKAGACVLRHLINMCYGVTIQSGYKYALASDYDFLVQIDRDGQHDASSIPKLIKPLIEGHADFVIGSRFLNRESNKPPLLCKLGMLIFK